MKKPNLVMHRLLGEHKFKSVLNTEIFERENICQICGLVSNSRPKDHERQNHLLDAYRHNMATPAEVMDGFGITASGINQNFDNLLKELLK